LKVSVPGRDPLMRENMPAGSEKFRRLTWAGFTSLAMQATAFGLDVFAITAEKSSTLSH
jgi:hypothetical protein